MHASAARAFSVLDDRPGLHPHSTIWKGASCTHGHTHVHTAPRDLCICPQACNTQTACTCTSSQQQSCKNAVYPSMVCRTRRVVCKRGRLGVGGVMVINSDDVVGGRHSRVSGFRNTAKACLPNHTQCTLRLLTCLLLLWCWPGPPRHIYPRSKHIATLQLHRHTRLDRVIMPHEVRGRS